jgi:hypothetical protein
MEASEVSLVGILIEWSVDLLWDNLLTWQSGTYFLKRKTLT